MNRKFGWRLAFLAPAGLALATTLTVTTPSLAGGSDDDLLFDEAPLDDLELSRNSGGTEVDIGDIGINVANNKATVSNNSVEGVVTTGTISENNLNDVSGINSLMYNTGNNVSFQSNMQINVFLK